MQIFWKSALVAQLHLHVPMVGPHYLALNRPLLEQLTVSVLRVLFLLTSQSRYMYTVNPLLSPLSTFDGSLMREGHLHVL